MPQVLFRKFDSDEVIALFPDEIVDNKGNIASYMLIGQHSAASPALIDELPEATPCEYYHDLLPQLIHIGYKNLELVEDTPVTYHREPTAYEISFGYGATHYRDFPFWQCLHPNTGKIKKWLIASDDGLRYYR
jgi:hypothetical protein